MRKIWKILPERRAWVYGYTALSTPCQYIVLVIRIRIAFAFFCLWVADIDTIPGCPVAIALMRPDKCQALSIGDRFRKGKLLCRKNYCPEYPAAEFFSTDNASVSCVRCPLHRHGDRSGRWQRVS